MKFSRWVRIVPIALVATLLTRQAGAAWTLTSADMKQSKGVGINEWSLKDGISYTQSAGDLKTAATRDVVSVSSDKAPAASAAKWVLSLRNGDQIWGEPTGLTKGKLQFNTAEFGTINVPLKLVAILQAADNKAPSKDVPLDRDVVRFKNGDSLDGVLVGLADGKVQMQHEDATTDADLARIDRLSLGGAVPARTVGPMCLRITLVGGTVLTTADIQWKIGDIVAKDYSGADVTCKAEEVKSIDVLGGRVVWLTDLDPARTAESSFLGATWPMQVNTSVMGTPLKIAGVAFDRGIGVHTDSTLEYNLDGSFQQLELAVGMDDSAAPYGVADVKVLVDGKVVWEKAGLKAGQAAIAQTIDIKNAHKVELVSTSPGTMDVLGRVDWVNVGLVRP